MKLHVFYKMRSNVTETEYEDVDWKWVDGVLFITTKQGVTTYPAASVLKVIEIK